LESKKRWSCSGVMATVVEAVLPAAYLVCLIVTWMQIGSGWTSTLALVGTYGTVPMIVNM
jgi:hypothetical protein